MSCNCSSTYPAYQARVKALAEKREARKRKMNPEKEYEKKLREELKDKDEKV